MARPPVADEIRFWSKVDKTSSPYGCWLWTATPSERYGRFRPNDGKMVRSHRYVWERTHGPIPETMYVCHNCPGGDNPRCCNPAHMFLGTNQDNMQDAAQKGRMATGERHGSRTHPERLARGPRPNQRKPVDDTPKINKRRGSHHWGTKLTDDDVRAIRAASASGVSQRELAIRYSVAHGTIAFIVSGKTWRHLL